MQIFNTQHFLLFSLVTSIIIVATGVPTIVKIANFKNLYDKPNLRKSHASNVPTLGGIAIYAGIIIPICIFTDFSLKLEFQYLIGASLIIFFIGLKDDILIISPTKKLIGQILSIFIIILFGNLYYSSLHGFWGIYHIPYWASLLLSSFVFIVIINGFNLIDGIDGLAAAIGFICSLIFGIFFYVNNDFQYSIISFTTCASLITFSYFNVFSKKYKIFMGDTGSLIIGLVMATLAVRFNELNNNPNINYYIHSSPAVSFGILIVPLFDTLRVFLIRILKGRSPFKADKNHVHHKFLAMGYSHFKTTILISAANLFIIAVVFCLKNWGIIDLILLIFILAITLSILPEILYFIKIKQQKIFK